MTARYLHSFHLYVFIFVFDSLREREKGCSNSPGTAGASDLPSKLSPELCHIAWCSTRAARASKGLLFLQQPIQSYRRALADMGKLRGPSVSQAQYKQRLAAAESVNALRVDT